MTEPIRRTLFGVAEGGQMGSDRVLSCRDTMEAAHTPRPDDRTERINSALEEITRNGALGQLLGQARACWHQFEPAVIEDALQDSIARAYTGCRAERGAESLYRWLEQDLLGFALPKLARTAGRAERATLRLAGREPTPDQVAPIEDAIVQDTNTELVDDLLRSFSPRDQHILRLAWGEGEERGAIAGTLGVSSRIVKRTLERAGGRLQRELCNQIGGGCGEEDEERVRAYAFRPRSVGVQDPAQARALVHLHSCQACAGFYDRLEQVRMAALALTPTPAATKPGVVERGTDRIAGATEWARDQVAAAYTRVHELAAAPPPVRPGAMLASLGVCAVAAGGSYCAEQFVPPLGALDQPAEERPEKKPERAEDPKPVDPPAVVTTPAPEPRSAPPTPPPPPEPAAPAAAPAPPAPSPAQAVPSPPAPQRDFEFEQSSPPAPAAPAPAPTQGGGEFP